MMPQPIEPDRPFDRIRVAIDEWLDAFDAESADLVRAQLAEISEGDTPQSILRRIENALQLLENDATRLQERGEEERRTAADFERRAFDAVRENDERAAHEALNQQNDYMERAMQHFDDALQLKWLLNQYRTAASRVEREETDDQD